MHEPTLKKKSILKVQYLYNIMLLVVLLFGVSYAVVNFLYNEEGLSGSIVSSLVKITVDEDPSFSLDNTSPVTDEEGLTGYSKTLTLTNTSTIDSLVNVTLNPDTSNDIETSYIKYGLYINGTLKKTASLTDTSIYNGLLLQGEKVTFEVYLWVDSSYTGSGTTFNGTFSVTSTEAVMTMADYVTKLVDKDKGVYEVGNDYRYSGNDADNYIWFNCKDGTTSGSNNCELWQIVGSLETKANSYANTYRRIKIVKVDSLDSRAFGDNNTFVSSTLHTYLNGDYYNSLTSQAQKMIISSEWNVGSSVLTNTPASSLTSEQASKLYTKVGLLSASDFGYSTNTDNQTKALNDTDLYTNSWLKGSSYYTLTPVTDNTTSVICNNATSITSLDVTTATGIKPVVSLIPNVYIKGGNGTSKMPYELAIVEEEEHYSDVKVVGYITYDVNGQTVSSPKMQPIFADGSTVIKASLPNTTEYKFAGWSTSKDDDAVYQVGDTITSTGDVTLYAKWKSMANYMAKTNSSSMAFWPTSIYNVKSNITQVNFVSLPQSEINTRYAASSIKEDVTDTTKSDAGSVLAWLENDTTDTTKYVMYVASDGVTYFPSNCQSMFYVFSKLTEINFKNINTSAVTKMSQMFYNCKGLTTLDLSPLDTSAVTDMSFMFNGCSGLTTLDLSPLDTSAVTTMSNMFNGCSGLTTLDLSPLDTSVVTTMSFMFNGCSGLTTLDLSPLDTSAVTTMSNMFNGCSGLTTLDLSSLDTSNVTDMPRMFYNCKGLTTLDLSSFDTSKVTDMSYMFYRCSGLTTLDLSPLDTSKVTNMDSMFSSCSGLTTLDLSPLDTNNVTNMSSMFSSCSGLTTLDLSPLDTNNVTNMVLCFLVVVA